MVIFIDGEDADSVGLPLAWRESHVLEQPDEGVFNDGVLVVLGGKHAVSLDLLQHLVVLLLLVEEVDDLVLVLELQGSTLLLHGL